MGQNLEDRSSNTNRNNQTTVAHKEDVTEVRSGQWHRQPQTKTPWAAAKEAGKFPLCDATWQHYFQAQLAPAPPLP